MINQSHRVVANPKILNAGCRWFDSRSSSRSKEPEKFYLCN